VGHHVRQRTHHDRPTPVPVRAFLGRWVTTFVNAPTTMPWGNRSLLLRDPDGNLVNLFSPATPAAKEKFSRYER